MPQNEAALVAPVGSITAVQAALEKAQASASQTDLDSANVAITGKASQTDLDSANVAITGKASQASLNALAALDSGKASQSDLDNANVAISGKTDQAETDANTTEIEKSSNSIDKLKLPHDTMFVLGGQSNSDSRASLAGYVEQPSPVIKMYDKSGNYRMATEPVGVHGNNWIVQDSGSVNASPGHSSALKMAKDIYKASNVIPVLVPTAIGSTNFTQWLPKTDDKDMTTLFGAMNQRAEDMDNGNDPVFVWCGHEANGGGVYEDLAKGLQGKEYIHAWNAHANNVRQRFPSALFMYAQLSTSNTPLTSHQLFKGAESQRRLETKYGVGAIEEEMVNSVSPDTTTFAEINNNGSNSVTFNGTESHMVGDGTVALGINIPAVPNQLYYLKVTLSGSGSVKVATGLAHMQAGVHYTTATATAGGALLIYRNTPGTVTDMHIEVELADSVQIQPSQVASLDYNQAFTDMDPTTWTPAAIDANNTITATATNIHMVGDGSSALGFEVSGQCTPAREYELVFEAVGTGTFKILSGNVYFETNLAAGSHTLKFKADGANLAFYRRAPGVVTDLMFTVSSFTEITSPPTYMAVTHDLPGNLAPDDIHLSTEAQVELGRRFALLYRQQALGHDINGTGARLSLEEPITVTGSTVSVRFDRELAAPKIGEMHWSDDDTIATSLFRVYSDGVEEALASVSLNTDTNIIDIVTTAVPAGVIAVTYGDRPASGLGVWRRGTVYDSDGLPAPMFGPLVANPPSGNYATNGPVKASVPKEGTAPKVQLVSEMTEYGQHYILTQDDGGATAGLYIKLSSSAHQLAAGV